MRSCLPSDQREGRAASSLGSLPCVPEEQNGFVRGRIGDWRLEMGDGGRMMGQAKDCWQGIRVAVAVQKERIAQVSCSSKAMHVH